MNRKQYLLLVAITMVAGLIGGAVSNWVLMVRSAAAQDSQVHEKVIKAEEFRLVDSSGRSIAALYSDATGPSFLLVGQKNSVILSANSSGSTGLSLIRNEDKSQITMLNVDSNGKPSLSFIDPEKNAASILALDVNGLPSLSFYREKGKLAVALHMIKEQPYLSFFDNNQNYRALMGLNPDNTPNLQLCDQSGQQRIVLGRAEVEATDIQPSVITTESSLVLFDKNSKVMWSAP